MNLLRRHRHPLARLAVLVLLLAALAPGVSRALAFVQGQIAPWSQVCTAPMDAAGTAMATPDGVTSHWLEHCPLCHLASEQPAWPPAEASPVHWAPAPLRPVPPLWLHAPRPLPVWAVVRSRAPPLAA
jgi:hypothetical protein